MSVTFAVERLAIHGLPCIALTALWMPDTTGQRAAVVLATWHQPPCEDPAGQPVLLGRWVPSAFCLLTRLRCQTELAGPPDLGPDDSVPVLRRVVSEQDLLRAFAIFDRAAMGWSGGGGQRS